MQYHIETSDGYKFNLVTSETGTIISNDAAGSFDWLDESELLDWVANIIRNDAGLITLFTCKDSE